MATIHGPKIGGCCALLWGAGSPYNSVAGAEAYLRAKFHLDPCSRLATIHQRHRQTDTQDKRSPKKQQIVPVSVFTPTPTCAVAVNHRIGNAVVLLMHSSSVVSTTATVCCTASVTSCYRRSCKLSRTRQSVLCRGPGNVITPALGDLHRLPVNQRIRFKTAMTVGWHQRTCLSVSTHEI